MIDLGARAGLRRAAAAMTSFPDLDRGTPEGSAENLSHRRHGAGPKS
jgi:hypothetical protein